MREGVRVESGDEIRSEILHEPLPLPEARQALRKIPLVVDCLQEIPRIGGVADEPKAVLHQEEIVRAVRVVQERGETRDARVRLIGRAQIGAVDRLVETLENERGEF